MFFGILKTQIVCRGAKIIFGQFVRVSKKGFSNKKMCTFCFCLFYVGERENMKKWKNEISKKHPEKYCFLSVCEENWSFFVKT